MPFSVKLTVFLVDPGGLEVRGAGGGSALPLGLLGCVRVRHPRYHHEGAHDIRQQGSHHRLTRLI